MRKKQKIIDNQIEHLEEDVHEVVKIEARQYNIAAIVLTVCGVLIGGIGIAVWHHLLH